MESLDLDRDFRKLAKCLSNGDSFLAEDLRNEMHVAVLMIEPDTTRLNALRIARWHALDYLRHWYSDPASGGQGRLVKLPT